MDGAIANAPQSVPVQQMMVVSPGPLADGVGTSEHQRVTNAGATADLGMIASALPLLLSMLKGSDISPQLQIGVLVFCGVLFTVCFLTKAWLVRGYSKDRTALKIASLPTGSGRIAPLLILGALLLTLSGCVSATAARKQGEATESADYEQTYANESARADSLAAANIINHTKRVDLELKMDLASLATQAKLDPIHWDALAIALETTRLQALHDSKIAAYNSGPMAASAALRAQNEAVNLTAARKLRDALNPPAAIAPVNQSNAIQATTGAPAPATLIQP